MNFFFFPYRLLRKRVPSVVDIKSSIGVTGINRGKCVTPMTGPSVSVIPNI